MVSDDRTEQPLVVPGGHFESNVLANGLSGVWSRMPESWSRSRADHRWSAHGVLLGPEERATLPEPARPESRPVGRASTPRPSSRAHCEMAPTDGGRTANARPYQPIADGWIEQIDATGALATPGRTGVPTAADLPSSAGGMRMHEPLAREEHPLRWTACGAGVGRDSTAADEASERVASSLKALEPVLDPSSPRRLTLCLPEQRQQGASTGTRRDTRCGGLRHRPIWKGSRQRDR